MKIAIIQTQSTKGAVQENIQNHVRWIQKAAELEANLVIFPELSLTSYEPLLAAKLATNLDDDIFDVFQNLSNKHSIVIGIGMPLRVSEGIQISMFIFQPYQKRTVYAKQCLHTDEQPYFIEGNAQTYLNIKNTKIALAICYESLQLAHFLNTKKENATIYIASVAKSQSGIEKANLHFSTISKKYQTPILMANCIGYCDNFESAGQSAVWNEEGTLMTQLNSQQQGIIIFDTHSNTTIKSYLDT